MIPLIKIRLKFVQRNPIIMCLCYLLIPLILSLSCLVIKFKNREKKIEEYEKFNFYGDNNESDISLFKEFPSEYYKTYEDTLYNTFEKASLVVNNSTEGELLSQYIYNITHKKVKYYNSSLDVPLSIVYIIEMNHDIKKNSYTFKYLQKIKKNIFSDFTSLSAEDAIDLFLVKTNMSEINQRELSVYMDLQSIFARFLIKIKTGEEPEKDILMFCGFNSYPPRTSYEIDVNRENDLLFGFIISIQYSFIFYIFSLRMIDEKEHKLFSLLERQGIGKIKYDLSWFLTYIFLSSFTMISFIFFMSAFLHYHLYLFIFSLLLFNLSLYSMIYFFSSIINSIKTASIVLKIFLILAVAFSPIINLPQASKLTKVLFSFMPQINQVACLCCIIRLQFFHELSFDKLRFEVSKTSFLESFLMYFAEIGVYLSLGILINLYKSGKILKFLTKNDSNILKTMSTSDTLMNLSKFQSYHEDLNPTNKQLKEDNKCLSLENVSKKFGPLKAVDQFKESLFPDEIFVLLGHNGAGKTTLIKMISGIEKPTNGNIFFNGKSLLEDQDFLFQNLGLCQQEDIFFDYLTVEEHLNYMCEIKGNIKDKENIDDLIIKIDLIQKKYALCKTLSGGQKRKLCLALALIGGSQIILLDEPTSGMDVIAKKNLWEFLKKIKGNKIIILTTHSLDEAEYLGDRIGIMLDGHYLCSGTSSFLKEKYPCGFNINFILKSQLSVTEEDSKKKIIEKIKEHEPNAEIKISSKYLLSINIKSDSQKINEIFQSIQDIEEYIEDYTVSSTSLEDVFLKLNTKIDVDEANSKDTTESNFGSDLIDLDITISNSRNFDFFIQLYSHIKRGFFPFYRSKILLFLEFFSGLFFVYIYVFCFNELVEKISSNSINLYEVLESNNEYFIYENFQYFENSLVYEEHGDKMKIKKYPQVESINEFINSIYEHSSSHIGKGGIGLEKIENNLTLLYNTEIPYSHAYHLANVMFCVSAFLKNEYNISASLFSELTVEDSGEEIKGSKINFNKILTLLMTCIISLISFLSFLAGLMAEKIKERRTNIKHLLYLSGSNMWSYWIGFLVVDYFKLMLFCALLVPCLYYLSNAASYFWLDLLTISVSSLAFIYFLSFLCSKEDSGQKLLFLITLGFVMSIVAVYLLMKLTGNSQSISYQYFFNKYDFTFFDLTPITSMMMSFVRILFSYYVYRDNELDTLTEKTIAFERQNITFYHPESYLNTNYIIQSVNFGAYLVLLIIAELGILGRFINRIKVKFLIKDKDFSFAQEEVDPDFIRSNRRLTISLQPNQIIRNESPFSRPKELPFISRDEESNNSNNNNNQQIDPLENEPLESENTNINNLINTNENDGNKRNDNLISGDIESFHNNDVTAENIKKSYNKYVEKEYEKVTSNENLTTKIAGLRKTYWFCCKKNIRAVNNLYLGLEKNERFGLLGFNGSGKTTTFQCITNKILFDKGRISLFGKKTSTQFNSIRRSIGYCPQVDPLFDFMKVKEIVQFYLKLKNYNESVGVICKKFGLSKYLDTFCRHLSGGNKRKLTFAIALMNYPKILLLDEPSTGVDPESRRIMWRNINELSNFGKEYNMILTTHSMEEAEILCDKVAWLKAGNFQCLGNPEQLKIDYSAGYILHIKFNEIIQEDIDIQALIEDLSKFFVKKKKFKNLKEYILKNKNVGPYIKELLTVLQSIQDKITTIKLDEIGKDYSFKIVLNVQQDKKGQLFAELLSLKAKNKNVSEINIGMESLEDLLTSLK